MKHTSGPWTIETDGGGHVGMIEVRGPAIRCVGFTVASGVSCSRSRKIQKDAKLIAAAPDLLDAAQLIVRHIDNVGDDSDLMECRKILVAAIAKATGTVP